METIQKKGWDYDYLTSQIQKYEDLVATCRNKKERKIYEDEIEIYRYFIIQLLLQEGEYVSNEISIDQFLAETKDIKNLYRYSYSLEKKFKKICEEFIKLPSLVEFVPDDTIEKDEAFDIVGTFIKSNFNEDSFQNFEDFFIKNPNHILFDKHAEDAYTTSTCEGEIFVSLPSSNDIKMVSCTSHEAGHIYRQTKNPFLLYDDLLIEYESFSYEFRLLIWMIKNNIHANDARKRILNMMRFLEDTMILRYYNNIYKFHKMKSSKEFEKMVHDLGLLNQMKLKNMRELFNILNTVLVKNCPTYLYSFLSVLDNLNLDDYLDRYNDVINNIGICRTKVLSKRILTGDITDLSLYKEYRNKLLSEVH